MNNNQKEYIVTKIKKYDEEIKNNNFLKKSGMRTFFLGALGLALSTYCVYSEDFNITYYTISLITQIFSIIGFSAGITRIILAIANKAKFKILKESIENLLNFEELKNEENIEGMHR